LATSNEYLVDEETRIVEGEIESLLVWKTLDRGEQNNRKRNHFTSSVFPEGANPPLEGQGITGHSRNVSLTKRVVQSPNIFKTIEKEKRFGGIPAFSYSQQESLPTSHNFRTRE